MWRGQIVIAAAVLSACAACSGELKKLPPGVCEQNPDCGEGERCNVDRSKCEDIYFPRREIKPY